jgi:hypothetical protein
MFTLCNFYEVVYGMNTEGEKSERNTIFSHEIIYLLVLKVKISKISMDLLLLNGQE